MVYPEPGTVYTYAVTTRWHDSSISESTSSYIIERVEERDDNSAIVKLTDLAQDTSFYWILDRATSAIYQSRDPFVDQDDLQLLLEPVKERERWEYGPTEYEIDEINAVKSAEIGEAHDVVELLVEHDDFGGLEISVEWSPEYGVLLYSEEYASYAGSYIDEMTRELTSVTAP
jgi:hypothetical protein